MMNTNWQTLDVRWQAVAISLLLSFFILLFPEIPNDDAYVYFRTAEIFLSDGFAAASAHYSWPAYSILIALVSKLGFSLLTSALLINTFFYALMTWAFLSLMMSLSDSRLVLTFAALTILVFPELNEFRFMVLRDPGFWALSVVAMWQLMRYRQSASLSSALLFASALLLAATLRIEALIYLAALPMVCLLPDRKGSSRSGKEKLLLPVLVYGSALILLVLLMLIGVDVLGLAGQFVATYKPFLINLFSSDAQESAALSAQLNATLDAQIDQHGGGLGSIIALVSELFVTLLSGMSGAFFWFLVYGAYRKLWPSGQTLNKELLAWLVINTVILLAFLVLTGFLTSRYVMILCLVLATQIPFVAAALWESFRSLANAQRYRVLLALFFVFCFIDAFFTFGRSRAYLQDAADYVAVHNQQQQAILTNNHSIAYASGLVSNYDEVARVPDADDILALPVQHYLALELIPQVNELLATEPVVSAIEFVTAFPSEAEPRVAIYRRVE